MTKAEADEIRALIASGDATSATLADIATGVLDELLLWQDAARGAKTEHDARALSNMARVARGEKRVVIPLEVEEVCACHGCKKLAALEEKMANAAAAEKRRRAVEMVRRGSRP